MAAQPALSRSRREGARPELREVPDQSREGRAARDRLPLVRGAGLVRRRALPAVERHPEQPHHALGRGDGRRQRLPQAVAQRERQHPRPPGPARHLRARRAARHAHRVRRRDHRHRRALRGQAPQLAERRRVPAPTARSGSPTRRSGSSATTRATRRRPSCRRTCTAWTRRTAASRSWPATSSGRTASRSRPTSRSSTSSRPAVAAALDLRLRRGRAARGSPTSRASSQAGPGTPDGLRVDVDGNLWVGWGMGEDGLDGVEVFNPAGQPHRPHRPARALRQPLLRRPPPQPAVHVRLDVALLAVRERAGGGVGATLGGGSAPLGYSVSAVCAARQSSSYFARTEASRAPALSSGEPEGTDQL